MEGGREGETERDRWGGGTWISLKSPEFFPSELLEAKFICFTGQYCLNSAHP